MESLGKNIEGSQRDFPRDSITTQGFTTEFHYYVCTGPVLVFATGACAATNTAAHAADRKAERSAEQGNGASANGGL